MVDQKYSTEAEQGSRKTCSKLVLAEQREGKSIQPVVERGLFEILYIVEMRGNEIPEFQHLARNLRIAPLVRVQEGKSAQKQKECGSKHYKEHCQVPHRTPVLF